MTEQADVTATEAAPCGHHHGNAITCRQAEGIAYHAELLRDDLERLDVIRHGCQKPPASARDASESAIMRGISRRISMILALCDDIETHTDGSS
jgi:hypothetical protein